MASTSTPTLDVIVLGAGSTGLLIAQGLKRHNIPFILYERHTAEEYYDSQREWSMALHWGMNYLKNTLPAALLERIDEVKADPWAEPATSIPLYDGQSGELAIQIPGGLAVRVNRGKLRSLLGEGLDIQFGKEAIDFKEIAMGKVEVIFADGSKATARTVVFADGIRSIGRTLLLGAAKAALADTPVAFVNICASFPTEQARFIRDTLEDPVHKFAIHPTQRTLFFIVAVDIAELDKPEQWKFQLCLSIWGAKPAQTSEERLRIFKEAAEHYAEPWKSAANWLPDDTFVPEDHLWSWATPSRWPTWAGRVSLAGDAAHPITPYRAQGLNNAVTDAHNYVQALVRVRDGKQDLLEAIEECTQETYERGKKEIELSNSWVPLLHDLEKMKNMMGGSQGYGQSKESANDASRNEKHDEVEHKISLWARTKRFVLSCLKQNPRSMHDESRGTQC